MIPAIIVLILYFLHAYRKHKHKNYISIAFISTNRGVSFVKEHHDWSK